VDWAGVALAAVAGAVAGGLAHVVMRRIGGSRLVRMLGNPAAATDHTKLCAAVGALYGEILALPPAEQGTTIRYLLASARAQHPLSPAGGGEGRVRAPPFSCILKTSSRKRLAGSRAPVIPPRPRW
jgi:hypothetical protein